MKNILNRKNNLIIFLHLILIGITLFYFWTQSRYPALDNKMFMGTRNAMTGISYDNIWPVGKDVGVVKKVLAGTVNWYYTNWKGMTFGFIFSGLLVSLASFIRMPTTKWRWLRPLYGAFIGAPMGVCANCATPITQGYKASGGNDETALAITLSSPTLNIIVLTILFQNFPNKLIGLKLAVTGLMIFILLPVLYTFFGKKDSAEESAYCEVDTVQRSFSENVLTFFKSLFRSFTYIAKTTLPLMLLAGLLGTIVFEFVDLNFFYSTKFSWTKLFLISGVGTFLPVPMTFDLIFSMKLLESQSNISFVAALMSTLGIFSIYPFMMFWKNFSPKIAVSIFVSVWMLGVGAGAAIHFNDQYILADFPLEEYSKNPVAFIKKTISETCGSDTACLKRLYTSESTSTAREELCQEFPEAADRNECHLRLQVLKLNLDYEKCSSFEKPEKCLDMMINLADTYTLYPTLPCELKGKRDEPLCRDFMALSASVFVPKFFPCTDIKHPAIKDRCLSLSSATLARFRNGAKIKKPLAMKCSNIENIERKNSCYLKLALSTNNPRWCGLLENVQDDQRNLCIAQTATSGSLLDSEVEKCENFEDKSMKQLCKQHGREAEATHKLKLLHYMNSVGELPLAFAEEKPEFDFNELKHNMMIPFETFMVSEKLKITYGPHQKRGGESLPFSNLRGDDFGIISPEITVFDVNNFVRGYGVAGGDLNNDHLQDFVIGSFQDINVFVNTGAGFKKIPVLFKEKLYRNHKINLTTNYIAFVDINNDGWKDLFLGNYDGNIVFVLNDKKYFQDPEFIIVPKGNRKQPASATFADFDRNGYLDLYLGNGPGTNSFNVLYYDTTNEVSRNQLFFNYNGKLEEKPIYDNYGVTISALASDMNNDGFTDLVSGNDFTQSDLFFWGDGKGNFREILPAEKIIPVTANNTMSIDTADIDNDLRLETFIIGMGKGVYVSTNYCGQFTREEKEKCLEAFNLTSSLINMDIKVCEKVKNEKSKLDCYSKALEFVAKRFSDRNLCRLIPNFSFVAKSFCFDNFATRKNVEVSSEREHPQVFRNVLLKQMQDGKFKDISEKFEATNSHYGWNSKFADLDNDSWQDVYAVNGRFKFAEIATNKFFHNQNGKKFEDGTKKFNLTDYADTSSYVYLDYDFDGDLDIISQGYVAPIRFFKNNESKNASITFELDDKKGNRAGIGAKVIITYNEKGVTKKQIREMKSGGGFASFDPYVLHFGLGSVEQIDSVEIKWATGEPTVINKPMPARNHYVIERK